MAGTGASSPFIKDEPEDQFFSPHNNQRFMGGAQQGFGVPQQHFNQFGSSHGGSINPSDLTMGGSGVAIPNNTYGSSYQNNFSSHLSNQNASFSKGTAAFDEDELIDSLGPSNGQAHQNGMQGNGQDFGVYDDFSTNIYTGNNGTPALSVDPNHINGYSNTPDGDPIQSPFVHNFQPPFRHVQNQHAFSNSLQSPGSYTGSPVIGSADGTYVKQRPRIGDIGRRGSSTRSPLTRKIQDININSPDSSGFGTQPIRTGHSNHRHQKSMSGQWDPQTPNSLGSFPGSDFSPIQGMHNPPILEVLKSGSMPAKLSGSVLGSVGNGSNNSQEMKRRRRRESHNLVERRRRDNINERIQELSHLVPMHRLEDEKVRKALQNNSPLSPTLAGLSAPPSGISPPQATSGLAGPGARRATAGNITTGIPIEEKDKGPNKGDILNGAVSWTRDLMWMLHLKLQQQEDLANIISDLGGSFPFEETEDERRMHTELMDAMLKNDGAKFHYSRAPGSGLRVPKHTDVKGDAVGSSTQTGQLDTSLSPDNHSTGGDNGQAGMGGAGQYWSGHNSGGSGAGSISFKEEDEYTMDLTQ